MGNKVEFIGSRYYIVNDEQEKLRMIPERFKDIFAGIKLENKKQTYLTLQERLRFEMLLYRKNLRIHHKYVYELIHGKKINSFRAVSVKFGDDRYEADFEGVNVVCSELLFDLAKKSLYHIYHIIEVV